MTKQEQITEMAKAMEDFELQNTYKCDIELAEHLYRKGYRKVAENAVVLTMEEAERFRGQTINIAKVKVQARKKTAKEFAEKLKEKTHNYYPSIDSYCCSIKVVELKDIYELLKEYGVEVE